MRQRHHRKLHGALTHLLLLVLLQAHHVLHVHDLGQHSVGEVRVLREREFNLEALQQ